MQKYYIFYFLLFYVAGFAQSVSLYNPANSAPYPSQLYFCGNETFNLKVDAVATSTGDYKIVKDLPSNYPLAAGGTPINFPASGSDKFSDSFPIGFSFSFYGKNYTKVVAGSNGRLVFTNDPEIDNLKNITTYTDRTFSGIAGYNTLSTLPSKDYNKIYKINPTQELNLAQIFFGYTDLIPKSQQSSVTYSYKNVSVGGVNALLVSYQNQIRSNGVGGFSGVAYNSSILLVSDGRVIIFVNDKSEINYNAILGIQNDDASKFQVPLHSNTAYNYNNGPWKSEGVAWLFKPNQDLTPQFKWFQNTTLLTETTNTLNNFAPNDADVLKVEVSFFDTAGIKIGNTETDQILFKKIAKPVITFNASAGCVTGKTLNVPADPDLTFQWFKTGSATVLGTGNSFYASSNGDYFVRVSRKTLTGCSVDSDPVTVNLNSTIPPFNVNNAPLNYCESNGAATKTINLYDYYAPNPAQYNLFFIDGITPVPDPTNFVLFANTIRTVGISATDPSSGCAVIRNFDLRFDSLPAAINNLPKKFCFGENSVDVSQYLSEIGGANFAAFDYQYSSDGTTYTTSSVFNPQTFPKIWIKILPKNPPAGSCFTVSTILLSADAKVIANEPTTQLPPQCQNPTETFDLASLIPEINPSTDVTVTFHRSLPEAVSGSNPVSNDFRGADLTTLYIRVVNNVTGCVSPDHPTITLLVYPKPNLLITSIPKTNCQGDPVFNLTQNISALTDAMPPVTVNLEFYSTNGALLTNAEVANYNSNLFGLSPYIKVVYNATCGDTIPFVLSFNPKPVAATSSILICGEITYSLEKFKNAVLSNPASFTLSDVSGNPFPANFDVTVLPKTVQFLIKDNSSGCLSDVINVTFVAGSPSVIIRNETEYELCDTNFDGKTAFNLDSKKTEFSTDPSAVFEYFRDAALTQSISSAYTNETAFAQTVFVRITLPGFCPTNAKINLEVNIPTKSSTLVAKYFICYDEIINLDAGSENVSFKWSTGDTTQTVDFNQAGNYSVELTNANGCSYTHNFEISSENQPVIEVINQTNTSIEVIANGGVKPYTYYFNGIPQSSNILQNPTASSYVIQVESATGCFGPPKTVYFIKINNAFTPNADGINDVWKVENLDKMEQVSINILDRNGAKVFESTNPSKTEWDGRTYGRSLPTSTYWYIITWFDPVTQKNEQRQGWILLKNRN